MPDLKWPDGRGVFRDHDQSRVAGVVGREADDVPLTVRPGDVIDVSDPETVDHYLDRGFENAEPEPEPQPESGDGGGDDDQEDDTDGSADDDTSGDDGDDSQDADFDVGAFLNRTPVEDVAGDIADGAADGHLDAVEAEASRKTVMQAVEDRRGELDQEQDDGGE